LTADSSTRCAARHVRAPHTRTLRLVTAPPLPFISARFRALIPEVLRRNVLIFHTGALGDFVLTWPLALALARTYAQSRILYVTHASKGELASDVLRVEYADIETGWHGLFTDSPRLPEPAMKLLTGAHDVFSFVTTPEDVWTRNLRHLAPDAKLMTLRPTPSAGYRGHASDYLVEQLRGNPIAEAAVGQILRSIGDRGISVTRGPGAAAEVVVHPGSGSRAKCWPLERFVALTERFRDDGRSVRFVIGEVELERWGATELAALEELATLRRPATYQELARELSSAALLIANDSGPGHLGGILGVPTLSLFGPTDPILWRPLGPRVAVLRHQPLDELSVDAVYEHAGALLTKGRA
jgi:heptosyltransferase III